MIKDYSIYNADMHKSLQEKLFFMGKINISTLVDYGCADGFLLNSIADAFTHCYGYDIDSKMLEIASNTATLNCSWTNNWSNIHTDEAILLSSVIHEVYSYGADIKQFWERVFSFEYVIIRDMIPSDTCNYVTTQRIPVNSLTKDFEKVHGSLTNNKNLMHYLLKYRFIENWDRELKENYFPLSLESLLARIPSNYEIVYINHHTPSWKQQQIYEDFNIILHDNTHLKLILKRKGDSK